MNNITKIKNYRNAETLRGVELSEVVRMIQGCEFRNEVLQVSSISLYTELKRQDDGSVDGANNYTDKLPRVCFASELENLKIRDITFDSIEFDGKAKNVSVTNARGHVELNTNSNLNIQIKSAKGKVDINHFHAVSKISFDNKQKYYLKNAGRFTRFIDSDSKILIGKRNLKDPSEETDLIVELNGWKSEIQILNTEQEK